MGPSWEDRFKAAAAAGLAAKARLGGDKTASKWEKHPAAPGCGKNSVYVILDSALCTPCFTRSITQLRKLISDNSTFHGWETAEEAEVYWLSAGFLDLPEC